MRKLLIFFVVFLTTAANVVSPAVSPAMADSRISSTVYGKTIFIGSTSNITNTASIAERQSTSDWANFKYEVLATQKSNYSVLAVFSQTSTAPCGGTPGTVASGVRTCTVALTGGKNILFATVATGTGSFSTSLQFTQTAGESQIFRIRSWIDRNNNDSVDAYEPSTAIQTINTVHPSQAKSYLNFQVDPPRYSEGKVTASVTNIGANPRFELFDPALVTMRVSSCPTVTSCERISGTTTYNAHPQLVRYEFSTSTLQTNKGGYAVELFYQLDSNTSILLDTKSFDYSQKTPAGVKTDISSSSGISLVDTNVGPGVTPRSKTTLAAPNSASTFNYRAVFSDTDTSLIANRQVYIFLDTKDLLLPSALRVDGIQISQATTPIDQIVISRYTDSSGVLAMNIQYPGKALEQLKIDLQVNGMRPYEMAYPGSEEVILWDAIPTRSISLTPSSVSGSSTTPITVTANVGGSFGGQAGDGSVLFNCDRELTVDTPIAVISPTTSAQTIVRISNFAPPSGTAYVYAQALSSTGWVTAKLQISWKNYGAQIVVGTFPTTDPVVSPDPNQPVISNPVAQKITKGTTNYLTITGLAKSDVVVIRRNSTLSSPTFSLDHTSAIFAWPVGKTVVKLSVSVNGKVIYSTSTK